MFDDYISIYDIQRAVQDGATVPIYYESRLATLALDERVKPKIDPEFEEATEGEEVERREKLKTKWAQLEAVVGAEKRVRQIAEDIVDHFEQRLEALDGKAMVVCMSRRICKEAAASEGVRDIFAAEGLDKPDISVLSEEFLSEVRGMPHRNLAVELLQKLLRGEVSTRRRQNVVQARSFAAGGGDSPSRGSDADVLTLVHRVTTEIG